MQTKIKICVIMFFVILFGYYIKSEASISAQSKQVNSGEQFSISITSDISLSAYSVKAVSFPGLDFVSSTGGTGTGTETISNALTEGGTTNLATFTFKAPNVAEDTKYTIQFSATGMGNENLEPVKDSQPTATVTVKAPSTSGGTSNSGGNSGGGGNTQTPPVAEKSTEARLSNLGIRPNDFSGFKRDTENYNVEVPNDVEKVEIYAKPVDSEAKISGTGNVSLKEGDNEFKITVTAEAGNTKTYTLKIRRETAEEANAEASIADLKSLGIKPEEYDIKGFEKDKTSYSVEVPDEVEEIEVYAEPVNSNAQINGIGMISLKDGKNEIKVEVIAEDGTKKTYTINVTRGTTNGDAENSEFGLKSLSIKGLTLSPSFKNDVYEYTVGLREDLSSLEIETETTSETAKVEITGNENLKQGENIITILVSDSKTDETATYQIIVNKNVTANSVKVNWLNPTTWGKEEIIKVSIIAVVIILIICAIILKIKISREENDFGEVDFPGADELNKALSEHQELSETEDFGKSDIDSANLDNSESEKNDVSQEIDNLKYNEQSENKYDTGESNNNTNYLEDIAKSKYNFKEFEDFDDNEKRGRNSKKGKHF